MTETRTLFIVLIILYAAECVAWVRHGSIVFRSFSGRRFQWAHPGELLGNFAGGFNWKPPVPGHGMFLTARSFPVSMSPAGVVSDTSEVVGNHVRSDRVARFESWDSIDKVEADEQCVRINGQVFLQADSKPAARDITQVLRDIKERHESARTDAVKSILCSMLSPDNVAPRLDEFKNATRTLRLYCTLLFVGLFLIVPTSVWFCGVSRTWPGILAGLILFNGLIARQFRRTQQRLFPHTSADWTATFTILLNPVAAMRALDGLSRHFFSGSHPVAIAKELCSAEDFKRIARIYFLDLTYPHPAMCHPPMSQAQTTESWFREQQRSAMENFLRDSGLATDSLLAPDAPAGATVYSYCPRCREQFERIEGTCEPCGGMTLRPLSPTP